MLSACRVVACVVFFCSHNFSSGERSRGPVFNPRLRQTHLRHPRLRKECATRDCVRNAPSATSVVGCTSTLPATNALPAKNESRLANLVQCACFAVLQSALTLTLPTSAPLHTTASPNFALLLSSSAAPSSPFPPGNPTSPTPNPPPLPNTTPPTLAPSSAPTTTTIFHVSWLRSACCSSPSASSAAPNA